MKCPFCSHKETKVIDKRESDNLELNRRRRECLKCGKRFTTYERIETADLVVIKKDGRREKFDREKLKRSILKACEKLPISYKVIEKTVDEIEAKIRSLGKNEIKSYAIGELAMKRLHDLSEVAYVRFASYYKHFTDVKSFERELKKLKVVDREKADDATDISLMVTTHAEGMSSEWNRERIVKTLMKEIGMDKGEANEIALAVEKKVFNSGIKTISVSLIRELVDNELFVRGHSRKVEHQAIVGMPIYNLRQVIFSKSKENSNILSNNPEAVSLAIAENALKQFALKEIFSKEVANAHLSGMLHLHNLGFPVRVYCSAHSLEYLKKFGLRLLNLSTTSLPAKHAGTLTGHLNTFLASMQAYYAGALGIGYINIFYAPYLVGFDYERAKQEAQYLIFSCSQNAFSRGGQTLFIDFNIHLNVPEYLREVPAIGPGGKYMHRKKDGKIEKLDDVPRDKNGKVIQPDSGRILTYGDFEKEAQLFARAMLDVWRKGDAEGRPFPFPKCDMHVDESSFKDPNQLDLLKFACDIASENGAPYFIFDRGGGATLSQCCRLKTKITDQNMLNHPESLRFCGFQNVTINLPQAAYRAKGDFQKTIEEVYKTMELAVRAHLEKKEFIKKIMSEPGSPLWQIGMVSPDGKPYLNLEEATYIIGLIGLDECVKFITGKHLHETDDAYKLGLKIVSAMHLKTKEFEKQHKLRVALEETPAESTSLRFARIDLMDFPESKDFVRGDQKTGEVYYTNSIHFVPDAPVSMTERIEKQAKFNPLIESGSITHVFLGEQRPNPESIFNLAKKTFENTQSAQLVISPEFTVCNDCHRVSRGYRRPMAVAIETKGGLKND